MLSDSPAKIHDPPVTGVSPRPTDQRGARKTAKHEGHGSALLRICLGSYDRLDVQELAGHATGTGASPTPAAGARSPAAAQSTGTN